MIGPRRLLLTFIALVAVPCTSLHAQDIEGRFRQGMELLEQGKQAQALEAFQDVLAGDPSHQAAYELWQNTEDEVWRQMLLLDGEFQLIAKRLMGLARLGRRERRNDPEAVRELLKKLDNQNIPERRRAIMQLASEFGEYAVPRMVHALADQGKEDRRVIFMNALTRMGTDVVSPLIEACFADDAFLRRNVVLTLGYIGDPRANGVLAMLANGDEDAGVRQAAQSSLKKTKGSMNALAQLLSEGATYSDAALAPFYVSDVIWRWRDRGLEGVDCPRFLYASEMAKKSFYRALAVDPTSREALAGLARVSYRSDVQLKEWMRAGQEVGIWEVRLAADALAVHIAGADALDEALGLALDTGDQAAASGLCQALGTLSSTPTANLRRALDVSSAGAIRGRAAVALGNIAYRFGTAVDSVAVRALAEAASREVVQIAAVIDGDATRRKRIASALRGRGMHVNAWPTGGRGLGSLRSIPGVDLLLIADELKDLTAFQVIDEIRRDPRTSETPILVLTRNVERADELFGERTSGSITGDGDLGAIEATLEGGLNSDREQANELAAEAAITLERLATTRRADVSSAADALATTLANRPDAVALPSMKVLGIVGAPRHVGPLVAVVLDQKRDLTARVTAGVALATLFARTQRADEGQVNALHALAVGDDQPFELRVTVAQALGQLSLPLQMRVTLMQSVRAR